MLGRLRNLMLTFLGWMALSSFAAAQPPAPAPQAPQAPVQPAPSPNAPAQGNQPAPADVWGPPPLQFAFLQGNAAEGELTLVIPQVLREERQETRTRLEKVVENGVTQQVEIPYTVTVAIYKVVPSVRPIELKDVLRWDGSAAAGPPAVVEGGVVESSNDNAGQPRRTASLPSAPAELVQKFIDRRVPVLLIESPEQLAAAPVNQSAIRPGALLVQLAGKPAPRGPREAPAATIELPQDPPPLLVVGSRPHGAPVDQEPTLILTKSVPVQVTKTISVQIEVNGEPRTEQREVTEIRWKPVFEQVALTQVVATDKTGAKLTAVALGQRLSQPTVCVDGRLHRFDPVYLAPLSDQVLILKPVPLEPAAGQAPPPAPKQMPPPAAAANDPVWIGRSVVPKPGIQLLVAGTKRSLDWRTVGSLPWKVTRENGDWVWIDKTWAKKSQVVRLGDTPRDQQLAQFSESVRKEPGNVWHYVNRSFFWEPHDVESVIADLNQAVRLDPKDDYIAQHRLQALQRGGHWQAAVDGWNQLLRTNPKGVQALAGRAMLLAACPDSKIRNGRQALADATQAGELSQWQDFQAMDALAAAYAETGDFAKAVQWKEKANEQIKKSIVQPGGLNPQFLQMLEAPLNLYRQGQPYRLSMQPNPPPPSATAVP